MSHHTTDERVLAELKAMFTGPGKPFKGAAVPFGPTGEFPDGKLGPNDEGGIAMGITQHEGRLVIDFGKPIRSLGLTAVEAQRLGSLLTDFAVNNQPPQKVNVEAQK